LQDYSGGLHRTRPDSQNIPDVQQRRRAGDADHRQDDFAIGTFGAFKKL
jgi:hypothetical protein